jgi:type IV secretory pathway VirB10-like protein
MTQEPREPQGSELRPRVPDIVFDKDSGPVVGRLARPANLIVILVVVVLAAVLFLALNGQRKARAAEAVAPAAVAESGSWSPPPLQLTPIPVSAPMTAPFSGLTTQVTTTTSTLPAAAQAPIRSGPTAPISTPDSAGRLRAPSVVVDLGGAPRDLQLAQASPVPGGLGSAASAAPAAAAGARPALNDSEQFAKRVGDEAPDRARAVAMHNLRMTAPQGTIIPGVLETAIDSDLPGFTRAIVSRDVLSFDGRAVLIPRSSRLIGQYKSAVALGQTRAFIIWTRVIRPDGVSIQIASPGTDELGRGGLDGKVDNHFFRRFSGSILLSVLNAGVAAVGRTPSTQISIGSPGAATGLANSAIQGDAIPTTIKVAQGEAINIFVARDLDFSGVEPLK